MTLRLRNKLKIILDYFIRSFIIGFLNLYVETNIKLNKYIITWLKKIVFILNTNKIILLEMVKHK